MLLAAAFCPPAHAQEKPQAVIMRLDGQINRNTVDTVEQRINQAVKDGAKTFILELDTPGGYLDESIELSDFIFKQDGIDVIAYVHNQAYSGGAMVALACKAIYIDAVLGRMGDVAPVDQTGQIMNEKAQSVVREVMTNYARARGYPRGPRQGHGHQGDRGLPRADVGRAEGLLHLHDGRRGHRADRAGAREDRHQGADRARRRAAHHERRPGGAVRLRPQGSCATRRSSTRCSGSGPIWSSASTPPWPRACWR